MKTTLKISVVVIAAIFLCCCTSKEEKMKKAITKYQTTGYTILSQSDPLSEADHFVLAQKDNQVFVDELSGKNSRHLVFPKEDGYYVKQIQLSMKDSVPTCSYTLLYEGNKVMISNEDYAVVNNEKLNGTQTLVFANRDAINSPCYAYCLSNPDTLFAFGEWKGLWIEKNNFVIQYSESLDKLFGDEYKDKTFDVVMYFSTKDMSFLGFYDSFGLNAEYNMDYIKNKYPGLEFKEQNNEIRFPLSWFGSSEITTIKNAIDKYESVTDRTRRKIDSIMKAGEARKAQLRHQQRQNNQNNNSGQQNRSKIWVPCNWCSGRGWRMDLNVATGRKEKTVCGTCGGRGGRWRNIDEVF